MSYVYTDINIQNPITIYATSFCSNTENPFVLENDDEIFDIPTVPSVEDAILLALSYDCVIGARAFNYKDKIVIALLTNPFYLKSERDGTRTRIQNELCDELNYDDIIVTFDVEVFRKIRGELSEKQMQKLMNLAKSR